MAEGKVTTAKLLKKKQDGEKIVGLTAYDYSTAQIVDKTGIDFILVGDSLGMVILGYENTLPVTMEDMLHHTKAVVRGAKRCMVVADLPFMSYQISPEQAIGNAGRLIQEAGAYAVKLEGGRSMVETISRIVDAGIPVMGHIGLQPQSLRKLGGYKIQGRTESSAERLMKDAAALEEAGVFAIVLELVTAEMAKEVSESVSVPTIGIGSGPHCDGQVQIVDDILGLYGDRQPKHAKRYANLSHAMESAVGEYIEEVSAGTFPGPEHSF
jgi:3-methyl-2-oxobutanoate hydroxymethyltransferase